MSSTQANLFPATILAVAALVSHVAIATADNEMCTAALGDNWVQRNEQTCTTEVISPRSAITELAITAPATLYEDPIAGPVVRRYLHARAAAIREAATTAIRANTSTISYQLYRHGRLRSVVFHESSQTVGNTANNAYRTFTFDSDHQTELRLSDLLVSGSDLGDLASLVRPYLTEALDRAQPPHQPGSYPFTTDRFEPRSDGAGFSGDYRAFAITPDELILYLPDIPMSHENAPPIRELVWSMDGGTVEIHAPLTALAPVLKPLR